jgi:hypothetical protein
MRAKKLLYRMCRDDMVLPLYGVQTREYSFVFLPVQCPLHRTLATSQSSGGGLNSRIPVDMHHSKRRGTQRLAVQ